LGYFGVLFSILFLAWKQNGFFALSPIWKSIYIAGVTLSTFGFARAGYGPEAIAGSTIVLFVWLRVAWSQKQAIRDTKQWHMLIPIGIVLAACCIPPIAALTRKQPTLAKQFVQTFLSLLLFLVAFPTLLARLPIARPNILLWLVSSLSGALFLGILPHPFAGFGLVSMGLMLLFPMLHTTQLPPDTKGAWILWAGGALSLGFQLLPNQHHTAIAGLHFTILGPVLLTAWQQWLPHTATTTLRLLHSAFLLLMCASIAAQDFFPHPTWNTLSAASGTCLGILACYVISQNHSKHSPNT
jgi:uncharacterized membrane protein